MQYRWNHLTEVVLGYVSDSSDPAAASWLAVQDCSPSAPQQPAEPCVPCFVHLDRTIEENCPRYAPCREEGVSYDILLDAGGVNVTRNEASQCIQCGKKLRNKRVLKIHSRVHTGAKPFHCTVCGATFAIIQTSLLRVPLLLASAVLPHHNSPRNHVHHAIQILTMRSVLISPCAVTRKCPTTSIWEKVATATHGAKRWSTSALSVKKNSGINKF